MNKKLHDLLQDIESFLKEILPDDILLYSVEETGIPRYSKIVITLDKKSGISIEECIDVHKQIIEQFSKDEQNILDSHTLEVTSCGLTRVLKQINEVDKNIGKFCRITLKKPIDKVDSIECTIHGRENECITFERPSNDMFSLNWGDIKKIQLSMDKRK